MRKIFYILFFYLIFFNAHSNEQFNFDVTEIEILDNGNKFIGSKRGVITTNEGIIINANEFEYDKKQNILSAQGNVEIQDAKRNYYILTEKIIYKKNEEIIFTKNGSEAKNINNEIKITAEEFIYNLPLNIIFAEKNVILEDRLENVIIYSDKISYSRNNEEITTEGKTSAKVNSKYNFEGEDVIFLKNSMVLSSDKKSVITDKLNLYKLDKFKYFIKREELKGENILISTNYNLPKNDKFYFSSAILSLKTNNFIAKDTTIKIHKNIFNNTDNDPRIKGVSSQKDGEITTINKGIFTSCKETDDCPPWSIQAEEIQHDRDKKQMNYKKALLKVYDIPVLYFPKFFHPDPTVERQSGLLKPTLNNSNILGSSVTLPYFRAISNNKDFTFSPTIFDSKTLSFQNEYRQKNKNSYLIADIGVVKDYTSPVLKKEKNLFHLFTEFDFDLNFENFLNSQFFLSIEKVTNDTYLKVFDTHITKSNVRPGNLDILNNEVKLTLNHEKYNFETGIETFENLQLSNNDRFQYILPYYNYDQNLKQNYFDGLLSFSSSGSNSLNETNNLKSNIINDLTFDSRNYITNSGFKNNLNLNFKNLNSIGKKNSEYKSSPQIEFLGLLTLNTSYPLIKKTNKYKNILTPKASFRFNPNDMKDYSSSENKIDINNIFANNRLGFNDTFESGKSLTIGLDYEKEKAKDLTNINNYFAFKLATVLRDEEENFVPKKTTINRKTSNIFGSANSIINDNLNFNYNFAIDNDFKTFEYNEFNAELNINNFITKFNFIEENGEMGDSNIMENSFGYNVDNNNSLSFKTRRNRKLNLTEYYDLVYEYKNDCLTAGIKYKKSFYEDRDLKPTENLLFTITLFPITTYEYDAKGFD